MELRQLRYFVAVAEELSFTRAAARVGIAQPPLSQQIKALEQELGVALFLRSKRHVALTAAGSTFLAHARRTLLSAEEARSVARSMGQGVHGAISVGAIYTAAYTIVPQCLRAFRAAFPLVRVTLREMGIAEQHRALHDGSIDVGLLRPPLLDATLDYVTLLREPLVAVLPARHALARQKRVSLAALAAEPFVSLPALVRDSVGAVVAEMFARGGLRPEIVQEVAEMHTLICLVASGLGVSVVPASVADMRMRDIAYRPILGETPLTPLCLATSRAARSLVAPHFVATVQAALKS